ncbi:Putative nagB/RpiA transferase, initiation factor 2B-like protein [Septoria linicola]|uniref:Translation initiation factor eIF2B subunit delta n=1 Tax=Septoria linicola TaxID=215465 RepID=A0A9Q9AN93_9PEZI|nr:putative nagB/RpiA transferase, initiation factor 2B-like protein [Septoria linicola]USW49540.1 Putative nagB/RpiA transferase, initiation factor 2B-like protein [Septoria linicola]
MSEQTKPDAPNEAGGVAAAAAAAAAAAVGTAAQAAAGAGYEKLSPAELKKRAKAEKQARRAAVTEAKGAAGGTSPAVNGASNADSSKQAGQQQQQKSKQPQQQKGAPKQGVQDKQGGAQSAQLPARTRCGSQSAPKEPAKKVEKKTESKNVELFSHLYTQPRRHNIDGASKDVHPAVLALGFQISSYEIAGSSARCVGMLNAFKEAIQEYSTPGGTSLARHMTSHHLSPQIDFLKSCRPISESMGNAIRWLKKLIVEIDPSTPEHEAKDFLCDSIDKFIQERIMVTDQAIATTACQQIKNGSVVLTYAKSSIVEKTILRAHANGVNFRVICIDSRPLFEGKRLATSLMHAGIQVEYSSFHGLARAVTEATVVLLGAHSMLSNGCLQSRVGTAAVAMSAHRADVPVIVCCESVKFSGKVALDSIVLNEVAPAEELLPPLKNHTIVDGNDEHEPKLKTLHDWKDIPNLQILNLMYDITPAEYIRMVICEYGSVPPSSVPVVHRLANEGE